jgi:Na+-driven multidrug efflux pump
MISIVQMAITAIGIGGMMIFQATGRWWRAAIAGIMQGIIYCIPLSFIIQYWAIKIHNVDLFLWCPFIVVCCSALTVFIWSLIYIRHHFLDKHAKLAPSFHNVKNLKQEKKILKNKID